MGQQPFDIGALIICSRQRETGTGTVPSPRLLFSHSHSLQYLFDGRFGFVEGMRYAEFPAEVESEPQAPVRSAEQARWADVQRQVIALAILAAAVWSLYQSAFWSVLLYNKTVRR
jgi:hypothetical protein